MEVLLDNRQTKIAVDLGELRNKAEKLLEDLGCDRSAILSISLVDAEEMADLNLRFRGKEGSTNVLSFPQQEGEGPVPASSLLGDVVVCTEKAAQDAMELGYTNDEMLLYLLIHGVLHLMGHAHDQPEDAALMEDRVGQIFSLFFPARS
jgi:probable rRNA maturation factor